MCRKPDGPDMGILAEDERGYFWETCGVDRVASVVCVRPGVGPISKTAVGEQVEDLLVGVVLRAEEDKVLKSVRKPVVVFCLGGQAEVAVHYRGLCSR